MKSLKVLFIDWHNTLSTNLFWQQLEDSSHEFHQYHQLIVKHLFKDNREKIDDWMRGRISEPEIIRWLSQVISMEPKIVRALLVESCLQMKFDFPEIISLVEEIRRQGILVVLATDNMNVFRKYTVPTLGLDTLFDELIISNEIQHLKADIIDSRILFFESFLEKRGLEYADCLLIDDSPVKLTEYLDLGFKRIKVRNPKETMHQLTDLRTNHH